MKPYDLYTGDNIKVMREKIADNSHDSCVTDGPYGIRFMGKAWDSFDIEKAHSKRNELAYNETVLVIQKADGQQILSTMDPKK